MLGKIMGWILVVWIMGLFGFRVMGWGKEVKEMKCLDEVVDKNIDVKDMRVVEKR